jgi:hypothetical protein
MSSFALVSTVDTMGPEFPSHCVMLFDSEREAFLYAMKCISEHDNSVKYVEDEGLWLVDDEHYDSAEDALDEWQNNLGPTEFFHVKPVRSLIRKNVPASVE